MKVFFSVFAFFFLILISSIVFSQTIFKSIDSDYPKLENAHGDLDRFLWSYAKCKVENYSKPIVDFNAIDNWQRIGNYLSVSNNGNYFAYTIERGSERSFDPNQKLDSLIVQSLGNYRRWAFIESTPGFFAEDSKQYIYQEETTLCFLQLNGNQTKYVKNVDGYKVPSKDRKGWLAYRLKNKNSDVVLQNLATGKEDLFHGISEYEFDNSNEWLICKGRPSNNKNGSKELLLYHLSTGVEKRFLCVVDYLIAESGRVILLKTLEKIDKAIVTTLKYVSLPEGRVKVIWSEKNNEISLSNYNIDKFGRQVVFSIRDSTQLSSKNLINNSIWYYESKMAKAIQKVTDETAGIDTELQIEGSVSFTDNGRYIKFSLEPKPSSRRLNPDIVKLEVWNHKDLILQSAQIEQLKHSKTYNSVINIEKGHVIQLDAEDKNLYLIQGDFAIVKKLNRDTYGDRFWENDYGYGSERDSNWLVSLNDGSHHLLGSKDGDVTTIGRFYFSPSGNYLIYFDYGKECHYFSYDLRNRKLTDISANVDNRLLRYIDPFQRTDSITLKPCGLAAWLKNDEGILVYDNNDIWKLDLQGKKNATNLTNGFGRSHDIIFTLFNSRRLGRDVPILEDKAPLLLRAFSKDNKYSGFYRKVVGVGGDPERLYMGKYFMNLIPWCQDPNLSNKGMPPVKAINVNTWIVQRQSDTDAPNYYKTTDFKSFEKLTDFQPQKRCNWLFEELHSFKYVDGAKGQGILYKPENFDSTKKYPVLIVFYGKYSDNLYQFPIPTYNWEAITPGRSPIWFLSNNYLIFTPDIYISPLKYGPEAFNVIEGAARYLKQLPYVDGSKLGCCSHSWSAKLGSYFLRILNHLVQWLSVKVFYMLI